MNVDNTKLYHAIIVAGGSGSRMRTDVPKQFIELCGKSILMHSVTAFADVCCNGTIVVVLPQSQIGYWQELCRRYSFEVPHRIAEGGSTRFHSVKNGLSLIPDNGLVAVHDGVRPLVNRETIGRCFQAAGQYSNAIPVVPVVDSVRELSGVESRMLERSTLRLVQTPQVFDTVLLRKAYGQGYTSFFTDDASVFEASGHRIHLVEGNVENIKITAPHDLVIVRSLMEWKRG